MTLFKYRLFRLMAFIVLWLTTGFIISVFTRPDFSPPTPSFMICAHKIGGDDRMLPVYPVQAYQEKPQDFKLCQAPFEYRTDNGYSHLTLTQDPKSGQYLYPPITTVPPTLWSICIKSPMIRLSRFHGDVGQHG